MKSPHKTIIVEFKELRGVPHPELGTVIYGQYTLYPKERDEHLATLGLQRNTIDYLWFDIIDEKRWLLTVIKTGIQYKTFE